MRNKAIFLLFNLFFAMTYCLAQERIDVKTEFDRNAKMLIVYLINHSTDTVILINSRGSIPDNRGHVCVKVFNEQGNTIYDTDQAMLKLEGEERYKVIYTLTPETITPFFLYLKKWPFRQNEATRVLFRIYIASATTKFERDDFIVEREYEY